MISEQERAGHDSGLDHPLHRHRLLRLPGPWRKTVTRNNLTRYILLYFASALFLLVFIGPFVWLVSSSLQLERQLVKVPPVWLPDPVSLASYKEIFMGAFFDEAEVSSYGVSSSYQSRIYLGSFLNSGIIALSVSFLQCRLWGLCRLPHRTPELPEVDILCFFDPGRTTYPCSLPMIPIVLFAKKMGMNDNLLTLIFISMSSRPAVFDLGCCKPTSKPFQPNWRTQLEWMAANSLPGRLTGSSFPCRSPG